MFHTFLIPDIDFAEYVEDEKKVFVFVDTQSRADSMFEQLVRCGYPSLPLHGGKEQEDRDSMLSDFTRIQPEGNNEYVVRRKQHHVVRLLNRTQN